MTVEIRRAERRDLDGIAAIFEEARAYIAELGIDQWQNGGPDRGTAEADILAGQSWVLCGDGDELLGVCSLITGGEPAYGRIVGGSWLTGNEEPAYLTVHRVAVSSRRRRAGAASEMMRFAERYAWSAGLGSVRIDTHKGNVRMRGMLEKNGYALCGVIYLANGDPRVAYEKRIGQTEEQHEETDI